MLKVFSRRLRVPPHVHKSCSLFARNLYQRRSIGLREMDADNYCGAIQLTYQSGSGERKTEGFDYLVVACDPRAVRIEDTTELEREVKSALNSFSFKTTLFSVDRPKNAKYAVRFDPEALSDMNGRPHGFRDEVFARSPQRQPDKTGKTFCTTYQLTKKSLLSGDACLPLQQRYASINGDLNRLMNDSFLGDCKVPWVDWTKDVTREEEESMLVDYFPHFTAGHLRAKLPWRIRDNQGEKNTIYVSSFTCFESVLHCYLYQDRLMNPKKPEGFPTDRSKKIAVIGAGPSGLLFASQHLVPNGFKNVTIFEKSGVIGGKTRTVTRTAPGDSSSSIPCELGTCYLSPAYEPMLWMFEPGEVVALDRGSDEFRSAFDPSISERAEGIEFSQWTVLKNMFKVNAMGVSTDSEAEARRIIVASVQYVAIHYAIMGIGINDAMPDEAPSGAVASRKMRDLINKASERETGGNGKELSVMSLFLELRQCNTDMLKAERTWNSKHFPSAKSGNHCKPFGLYAAKDDIEDLLKEVLQAGPIAVSKDGLLEATKTFFDMSFGQFLDKHGLGSLRTVFSYSYELQGYGSLDTTPCYYGLIWITPAIVLEKIKLQFMPPTPNSAEDTRGTVYVVKSGWMKLWSKIEEDIKREGCAVMKNVSITSIRRSD